MICRKILSVLKLSLNQSCTIELVARLGGSATIPVNETIRLDNQLCYAVYNANRLFNKFYQLALAPFHLTYAQYVVLLALWEEDGLMLHTLGRRLHLESSTLTPLLKRLESAGWLVRRRSSEDKRQLFVHLTDFGRRTQSEVLQAVQNCGRQTDLTEDQYRLDLKTIQELNAALRKSITDIAAEH